MSKLVPIKVLDTYVVIDISSREVVDVSRPMYHKLFRGTKFANEMATLLVEKDQRIRELEEQLVNAIVPKFKVGDIVYFLSRVFRDDPLEVCSFEVSKISIYKQGIYYSTTLSGNCSVAEKECFATKAEALVKLEEMKGE